MEADMCFLCLIIAFYGFFINNSMLVRGLNYKHRKLGQFSFNICILP